MATVIPFKRKEPTTQYLVSSDQKRGPYCVTHDNFDIYSRELAVAVGSPDFVNLGITASDNGWYHLILMTKDGTIEFDAVGIIVGSRVIITDCQ
jgi:hypothetical protein